MTYAGSAYGARPYFGVEPLPIPARVPAGYEAVVMADGPQGYWRLGDAVSNGARALDVSGNSRTGTYTVAGGNAATVSGLLAGDSDTAVSFTGGYMRVPGDTGMESSQFITAEAIIQPSSASLVGNQPIVTRWVSGQSQRWILWLSSGKVQGLVFSGANGTATGATTLVAGQKYHVAMTYDGFTIRVYLNGVLDGSASFTNGILTSVGTPFIDVARVSDATAGTITVDEVAFYLKAVTQARLAAHYTAAVTVPALLGSLGGSLPRLTAAMAGTSNPPPARSGSLAGTLPRLTATAVGTSTPPGIAAALSAGLPRLSGTLTGTRTLPARSGALSGLLPSPVAALAGTHIAPLTATLSGSLPALQATAAGHVQTYDGLAALLPALVAELTGTIQVVTGTDRTYGNDGYTYNGSAEADYTPAVADPPPHLARQSVRRIHVSLPTPTLVRGRPQ